MFLYVRLLIPCAETSANFIDRTAASLDNTFFIKAIRAEKSIAKFARFASGHGAIGSDNNDGSK